MTSLLSHLHSLERTNSFLCKVRRTHGIVEGTRAESSLQGELVHHPRLHLWMSFEHQLFGKLDVCIRHLHNLTNECDFCTPWVLHYQNSALDHTILRWSWCKLCWVAEAPIRHHCYCYALLKSPIQIYRILCKSMFPSPQDQSPHTLQVSAIRQCWQWH